MAHFVSRFLIALLCLLFWQTELLGQIKVCSWNIQHLGKTKSHSEIAFMANTIKDFDIVAIQEVVAGYGGSQAVARLADALNRKGSKWEYIISDPTNSSPHATERYAFLWKASKVKGVREAWLDKNYETNIDREPFLMDFIYNGNNFTLVNFHAIPKKKQPEKEIKYFKYFPEIYTKKNLIFLGDFNVPETHTVFNPLKKIGYKSALTGQKTTMKMKCVPATCLASEYDNIFYNSQKIILIDSGVELIYKSFPNMVAVRRISDHIPIWMEFDISTTTSHHTPVATSNK
jgi:deoxyribonuclease-1-like protein